MSREVKAAHVPFSDRFENLGTTTLVDSGLSISGSGSTVTNSGDLRLGAGQILRFPRLNLPNRHQAH